MSHDDNSAGGNPKPESESGFAVVGGESDGDQRSSSTTRISDLEAMLEQSASLLAAAEERRLRLEGEVSALERSIREMRRSGEVDQKRIAAARAETVQLEQDLAHARRTIADTQELEGQVVSLSEQMRSAGAMLDDLADNLHTRNAGHRRAAEQVRAAWRTAVLEFGGRASALQQHYEAELEAGRQTVRQISDAARLAIEEEQETSRRIAEAASAVLETERAALEAERLEAESGVRAALQAIGDLNAYERRIAAQRVEAFAEAGNDLAIPSRRNRPAKLIDRVLSRLKWPGVALILARSGLWSGKLRTSLAAQAPEASIRRYARGGPRPDMSPRSLFDQAFYLDSYPDVARGRLSPLAHYLVRGDAERRSPHPLVSVEYYRSHSEQELGATGLTVLQHFLVHAHEGRNPHPLFDVYFYVGQLSDPEDLTLNPLVHYLRHGWRRGLNPHPLFDNDWYLERYPDVGERMIPPLLHFVMFGADENRQPHPLFHGEWYKEAYPDVASSGMSAFEHFVLRGLNEKRNPNSHFSTIDYLAQAPEIANTGQNPLHHYVETGAWANLESVSGWDSIRLLRAAGARVESGRTPLEAWISAGSPETPRSDDIKSNESLPAPTVGARAVQLRSMRPREPGRAPKFFDDGVRGVDAWSAYRARLEFLYDDAFYRDQVGETLSDRADGLEHYLEIGWRAGFNPHPLFDGDYYLWKYRDVSTSDMPPLVHYLLFGGGEARDPHPLFDAGYYCERYPDVPGGGENPLVHFIAFGRAEGRALHALSETKGFASAYPEVRSFLKHGRAAAGTGAEPVERQRAGELPGVALTGLIEEIGESRRAAEDAIPALGEHLRSAPAKTPSRLYVEMSENLQSGKRSDTYDQPAYAVLSQQLEDDRLARDEAGERVTTDTIDLASADLSAFAAGLSFPASLEPDVSIIVTGHNRLEASLECLGAIARAGLPRHTEVLFVDDGSFDRTTSVLPNIRGLEYVRNRSRKGVAQARNDGAARARGSILIFVDVSIQVQPGWLSALVRAIEDSEGSVGVSAPTLVSPEGEVRSAGRYVAKDGRLGQAVLADPGGGRVRSTEAAPGACFGVSRDAFNAAGGCDAKYKLFDWCAADISKRIRAAGYSVVLAPGALVVDCADANELSLDETGSELVEADRKTFSDRWEADLRARDRVRPIAFYLPQFHTIPENDAWWGRGFTEWTNVGRALPNYLGQNQPQLPGELGYYDISDVEVMERQVALAREHGIEGFCYYYYWFGGRRVLEKPLERMLKTGRPDFPFALCWANENWTRAWDGAESEVLLKQSFQADDAERFIRDVIPFFEMKSYIRVGGRPMLVVYRPDLIPETARVAEQWRETARASGIGELYLVYVESFQNALNPTDPKVYGFDASIEFPPADASTPIDPPGAIVNPDFHGVVHDYRRMVRNYFERKRPSHTRFRGVMPAWDNTARRQDNPHIFAHASPGAFQAWLEAAFDDTRAHNTGDERMVFINAWNEWAEGAHLEPDAKFGRGWLEAVKRALRPI